MVRDCAGSGHVSRGRAVPGWVKRFDAWCTRAREVLEGIAVDFAIQTNGTLVDADWAEVFGKTPRGCRRQRGRAARDARPPPRGSPGAGLITRSRRESGHSVPREFRSESSRSFLSAPTRRRCIATLLSLGSAELNYLMPDFTHDTIGRSGRATERLLRGFWTAVFDDWWFHGTLDVKIGDFWNIARVVLGGSSGVESLGGRPPFYVCGKPTATSRDSMCSATAAREWPAPGSTCRAPRSARSRG